MSEELAATVLIVATLSVMLVLLWLIVIRPDVTTHLFGQWLDHRQEMARIKRVVAK